MYSQLTLPKFLDIPDKLLPILDHFNEYRIFLIDGGRGGAKSHSVARILLYLADKYKIRIAGARETQNSIAESVHQLLSELIREFNLMFDVQTAKISHPKTESEFIFLGLREQGRYNIKSLEGIDILWIEEGQVVTKPTMDVVMPTIRKPNSKIFVTMNRHQENDPIYTLLVNRPDCLHININYLENEHCSQELIHEAEVCKAKSESDYRHIWLGEPLAKSEDFLFSLDMIRQSLSLDLNRIGIQRRVLANDVARYGDCENVFSVIESRGPIFWEQIHQECFKNWGLDETVGKHLSLKRTMSLDLNIVDDDGMGGGVTDNIHGIELIPFSSVKDYSNDNYADRRTDGYFKLQDWMSRGWLKILNDPILHEQLLTIRYRYANTNGKKRLFTKEEMRKEGIVSPDRADALMMAVYYADQTLAPGFGRPTYALHNNPALEREVSTLPQFARMH